MSRVAGHCASVQVACAESSCYKVGQPAVYRFDLRGACQQRERTGGRMGDNEQFSILSPDTLPGPPDPGGTQ